MYTKQCHSTDTERDNYSFSKLESETKLSQSCTNICHVLKQELCTITETNKQKIHTEKASSIRQRNSATGCRTLTLIALEKSEKLTFHQFLRDAIPLVNSPHMFPR